MAFTSLDKALTDRIVRLVITLAGDHKTTSTINGAFPNTAEGRHDKRKHDALCRDAADLKSLQGRMIKEVGDASVMPKPRAPKEKPEEREHPAGSAPGPDAATPIIPFGTSFAMAEAGGNIRPGDVVDSQLRAGPAESLAAHLAEGWQEDARAIGTELAQGATAGLTFNGDELAPKTLVDTPEEKF